MTSDLTKSALAVARSIQNSVNELTKPPSEITPSRSEPVLPVALFKGTRGYLEKVVAQINRCYEHTCYDACAVMIRRLVEILIIESFEHHKIEAKIKGPTGDFLYLQDLITITLAETSWNLGRNAKAGLSKLKTLGDKSAHNRRYNAQRTDVDAVIVDLRTVSEELLYISGLKK